LSEAEKRKMRLAMLMNNNKPEANDGDIDQFYSFDPSMLITITNSFRQA